MGMFGEDVVGVLVDITLLLSFFARILEYELRGMVAGEVLKWPSVQFARFLMCG